MHVMLMVSCCMALKHILRFCVIIETDASHVHVLYANVLYFVRYPLLLYVLYIYLHGLFVRCIILILATYKGDRTF